MKANSAGFSVAVVALTMSLTTARAQVLFDNGPSTGWNGIAHDLIGSIQAEDLTIADPVIVTAIRFYAIELGSGYAGSILWSIRHNQGGVPAPSVIAGDLSEATRKLTGVYNNDHFAAPESLVTVEIPPVTLDPGHYWLTLHNGPLSDSQPSIDSRVLFMWQSTSQTPSPGLVGVEDVEPFDGTWEIVFLGERSFQLIGVPEPVSVAPLLFMCVATMRPRRASARGEL